MLQLSEELDRRKLTPTSNYHWVLYDKKPLTATKQIKGELPPDSRKDNKLRIKQEMMAGKANDPLKFIYEDIADRFEPSFFKKDFQSVGDRKARHQRYKIVSLKMLIPTFKDKPVRNDLSTYV